MLRHRALPETTYANNRIGDGRLQISAKSHLVEKVNLDRLARWNCCADSDQGHEPRCMAVQRSVTIADNTTIR
jgi:hypothetical protein